MSTIKDGGPAFPVQDASTWQAHGMTLRDYFAAHASEYDIRQQGEVIRSALMTQNPPTGILPDDWHITARYMHADAMLKAREGGAAEVQAPVCRDDRKTPRSCRGIGRAATQ